MSLHFLYDLISKNDNYMTKNEILDDIKFNIINIDDNIQKYVSDIEFIINSLDRYVNQEYLIFENNRYYINLDNPEYIKYINSLNILDGLIKYYMEDAEDAGDAGEEEDTKTETEYYICNSFSNNKAYVINKNLTTCNCYSYIYCTNEFKTCKHLDYFRNLDTDMLNKQHLINFEYMSCSCNSKYCKYLISSKDLIKLTNN